MRGSPQWLVQLGWTPGLLCVDSGTELNSEEFSQFLQRHSVRCRTCAAEAHWQNARRERHGGILQLMLNKMDHENPIQNYDQVSIALSHATSTKNQWSKYRGYPPEVLVFGQGIRVPGSVTSDSTIAAHAQALANMPDGQRFRQDLATREAARRAFAEVDNDQTPRRAIVQRSRPNRGFYEKGEWVMIWKKRGQADGNWIGPMQVIVQENQNVIWVTRHHKLYRVPPEYVRSLSAMEEIQKTSQGEPNTMLGNQSILPSHGGVQYHDLIPSAQDPTASVPAETHEPNTRLTEGIPATQASGSTTGQPPPPSSITSPQVEQPDVEPEVQSIPSSNPQLHSPRIIPDINAPVEVPVPETSDEENGLYLGELPCYHLQEDQVFRFEVNINQRDADHWKEET